MSEAVEKKPFFLITFIRRLVGFLKTYFMIVGIFVTIGPSILFFLWITAAENGSVNSRKSTLVDGKKYVLNMKLEGPMTDRTPSYEEKVLSGIFGEKTGVHLSTIAPLLREAAHDKRIAGIYLNVEGLSGSLAAFTELRRLLAEFHAAGKPIHAWVSNLSNKTLYLGSIANRLSIAPAGSVMIPGPMFQLAYFGEALKKLGIGIDVIRSGQYKSAFEPLITNAPSEASIEMYSAMEKSLRDHMVTTILSGRRITNRPIIDGWFEKSIFTASEAKDLNIVDDVSFEKVAEKLFLDETKAELVSIKRYRKALRSDDSKTGEGKIALIEAVGSIYLGSDGPSEDSITPDEMLAKLKWAGKDEEIKGVVLRVSSPGGSALASDIIWKAVKDLNAKKPVVVSMGDVAASGGYYISAPASKILAEPTTITGSIGVIGMIPNFSEFEEKYGISFHMISESNRKDLFNPGTPLSASDKDVFSFGISEAYQLFLSRVAEGRKKNTGDIDKVARGRVWTGGQALGHGLIDQLGGLKDAFQETKKLAKLDPNKLYEIVRYEKKRPDLMECLQGSEPMIDCLPGGGLVKAARGSFRPKSSFEEIQILQDTRNLLKTLRTHPIQAVAPQLQLIR